MNVNLLGLGAFVWSPTAYIASGVLIAVLVLPAAADVVELKTGQRVEGALKQATPGGVSIEVGGQQITFPVDRVRAIYFGASPAVGADARPGAGGDALRAVMDLSAAARAGVTLADYSARVATANGVVERGPATTRVREAMRLHILARRAWGERVQRGRLDLREDPLILPCLIATKAVYEPDARSSEPLAFSTQEALLTAQHAFWTCAAIKTDAGDQ